MTHKACASRASELNILHELVAKLEITAIAFFHTIKHRPHTRLFAPATAGMSLRPLNVSEHLCDV